MTPVGLELLDNDELLAELDRVAADLETENARVEKLYEVRLAIYLEARRRTPPITQAVLAEHAKTSEIAVTAALRKARKLEEAKESA